MNEVIKAQSVESICANRDAALKYLADGLSMLHKAETHYMLAVTGGKTDGMTAFYTRGLTAWSRNELIDIHDGKLADLVTKYRKALDGHAWKFLRDATGLKNLMDATAIGEFDRKLEYDPPELTVENVQATFADANEHKDDIFERGVLEVFDLIRQASRRFKTSDPGELGARFVLPRMIDEYGLSYSGSKRAMLDDLERIFFVVDGKRPPDPLNGLGGKINGHARKHGLSGVVQTEYMDVKLCKNQNVHVHITNNQALVLVNRIIAKHYRSALPDDRNRPARER
jgi:hypothetical protein